MSLKRALLLLAAVAAAAGTGAAWGWKFTSPGQAMAALAQHDTVLGTRIDSLGGVVQSDRTLLLANRDTLVVTMRPVRIWLCLNTPPRESVMLGVDCDSILRQARASVLR